MKMYEKRWEDCEPSILQECEAEVSADVNVQPVLVKTEGHGENPANAGRMSQLDMDAKAKVEQTMVEKLSRKRVDPTFEQCEYTCRMCAEKFKVHHRLFNHVGKLHKELSIKEYKNRFGQCLTKTVMHQCRLCSKEMLHTKVIISRHLWHHHSCMSTTEYKEKYLTDSDSEAGSRTTPENDQMVLQPKKYLAGDNLSTMDHKEKYFKDSEPNVDNNQGGVPQSDQGAVKIRSKKEAIKGENQSPESHAISELFLIMVKDAIDAINSPTGATRDCIANYIKDHFKVENDPKRIDAYVLTTLRHYTAKGVLTYTGKGLYASNSKFKLSKFLSSGQLQIEPGMNWLPEGEQEHKRGNIRGKPAPYRYFSSKCEYFCRICSEECWSAFQLNCHLKAAHQDVTVEQYKKQCGPLLTKEVKHRCCLCNIEVRHTEPSIKKHLVIRHRNMKMSKYVKRLRAGERTKVSTELPVKAEAVSVADHDHVKAEDALQKMYTGEKQDSDWFKQCRFDCRVCRKRYQSQSSLLNHISKTHQIKVLNYVEKYGPLMTVEKNHTCHICGAAVTSTLEMIGQHLWMHSFTLKEYSHKYMGVDVNDAGKKLAQRKEIAIDTTFEQCEYTCGMCAEKFHVQYRLFRHVNKAHMELTIKEYKDRFGHCRTKTVTHRCRICNKELLHTKSIISKHLWRYHSCLSMTEYEEKYLTDSEPTEEGSVATPQNYQRGLQPKKYLGGDEWWSGWEADSQGTLVVTVPWDSAWHDYQGEHKEA